MGNTLTISDKAQMLREVGFGQDFGQKNPPATAMAGGDGSHKSKQGSHLVCLADVEPKEIAWLWYPYIPSGKITLLRGDPGQGKTTFCLTLASIVSNGWSFPNSDGGINAEQGNVLFISAEDDLADTISPRLIKARANMSRVFSNQELPFESLTFTSPAFEELIGDAQPKLVIVDPIQAFLGGKTDAHRANEIRPIMSHLRGLAEKYNCAILLIEHLNKSSGGKGLYRGLGSIDITAAARSILMLGSDPDNGTEKGIAHIKSNCASAGGVVGFHIANGRLVWNLDTELTADMIQGNALPVSDKQGSKLEFAKDFLRDNLKNGKQHRVDVLTEAQALGISEGTLKRGRQALGIVVTQEKFGKFKETYWSLP